MDFEKLQQMIDELMIAQDHQKKCLGIVRPSPPPMPKKFDGQDDWDSYERDCFAFTAYLQTLEDEKKQAVDKVQILQLQIVAYLPANAWFKTKDFYVGYHTSSWPMYQPKLEVMQLSDNLPQLYHDNS